MNLCLEDILIKDITKIIIDYLTIPKSEVIKNKENVHLELLESLRTIKEDLDNLSHFRGLYYTKTGVYWSFLFKRFIWESAGSQFSESTFSGF